MKKIYLGKSTKTRVLWDEARFRGTPRDRNEVRNFFSFMQGGAGMREDKTLRSESKDLIL